MWTVWIVWKNYFAMCNYPILFTIFLPHFMYTKNDSFMAYLQILSTIMWWTGDIIIRIVFNMIDKKGTRWQITWNNLKSLPSIISSNLSPSNHYLIHSCQPDFWGPRASSSWSVNWSVDWSLRFEFEAVGVVILKSRKRISYLTRHFKVSKLGCEELQD